MIGPRSARAARRAEHIASKASPASYSSSSSSPCNTATKSLAIRPENRSAADLKQKGKAVSVGAVRGEKLKSMSTLAQRRASLLAQPSSRRGSSTSVARSSGPPAPGSAAAHILNPDAFRPVHLYPQQIALHVSFTPPHMPLPVHLGTGRYKSTRYKALLADDPFQVVKGPSPSGVLRSMAGAKGNTLGQHLGVTSLLDQPEHAKHLLPEHGLSSTSKAPANPFLAPSAAPRAEELDMEVDFDRMIRHNERHSPAAQNWHAVLNKMDAAVGPTAASSSAEISDAVAGIDAMLARMDVQATAARPAYRARAWTRSAVRPVAFHRQGRGADIRAARMSAQAEADGVKMDSVKRKRKKKISKHKYKKRRKATRSERKRLGK